MVAKYGRLNTVFVNFMAVRQALPKESVVTEWLRTNHDGVKNGVIGRLYAGKHVPLDAATKFVHFLLDSGNTTDLRSVHDALMEYLSQQGTTDMLTPESIAAAVLEDDDQDRLQRAIDALLSVAYSAFSFHKRVQLCKQSEIRTVSTWFNASSGYMQSPRASFYEAIELGEKRIALTGDEFATHATIWSKFQPWTVVLARHKNQSVGAAITLPLSQAMYDNVRAGNIHPCTIPATGLEYPSNYLLIAACGERPVNCDGPDFNVTSHLSFSLMRQIAVLSHRPIAEAREPLHVLSFGTTDLHEHRLQTTGFKKTGTKVHRFGYPLYEFILPANPSDPRLYAARALLQFMGNDANASLA